MVGPGSGGCISGHQLVLLEGRVRCFLLGEDTDGVSGDDDDGCIALVRDYDSREGLGC